MFSDNCHLYHAGLLNGAILFYLRNFLYQYIQDSELKKIKVNKVKKKKYFLSNLYVSSTKNS